MKDYLFIPFMSYPPISPPWYRRLSWRAGGAANTSKERKEIMKIMSRITSESSFFMGNPVFCVSHVDNRSLLMIKKREKKKANCELTVVCAIQQKLFVCRHLYSKRPNGVGRLCKKKYTNGLKFVNFVILWLFYPGDIMNDYLNFCCQFGNVKLWGRKSHAKKFFIIDVFNDQDKISSQAL